MPSNVNQRIGAPFGDIYFPPTTSIDNAASTLFRLQQQKQMQQQAEQKALDDEFARNMSGIRDVDIPDFTKAYGDYKLANQVLLKNKEATPEQQIELLRKKANIYKLLNESKAQRAMETEMYKGVTSKPDNFKDDAHSAVLSIMRTPLSQFTDAHRGYNPTYDGADYDLQGSLKSAQGSIKTVEGTPIISADKVKYEVPVYQTYSTSPDEYKRNLLATMGKRKALKAFTYNVKNLPEDELLRTDAAFRAIPDEVWGRIGLKKPNLTVTNPYNEAEQAANYYAQLHAIEMANGALKPVKTLTKYDWAAQQGAKNREWDRRSSIDFGRSMQKIYANKSAGNNQEIDTPYISDRYVAEKGIDFTNDEAKAVEKVVGFTPLKYVLAKDIDANDYNVITGKGISGVSALNPVEIDGVKMFIVDDKGDWYGDGNRRGSRESIKNANIQRKENTKFKATQSQNKSPFNAGSSQKQSTQNTKTTSNGLPLVPKNK